MKSPITTHVLDTSKGCPAEGIEIRLEIFLKSDEWKKIAVGKTNNDGRIGDLLPPDFKLENGTYRLTFETAPYFQKNSITAFYPYVVVVFEIQEPAAHYHVPLLLNPYGYSTYRGS